MAAAKSNFEIQLDAAHKTLEFYEARLARDEEHFWQIIRYGSLAISIFAGAPMILLVRSTTSEQSTGPLVAMFAFAAAQSVSHYLPRALVRYRRMLTIIYGLRNRAEEAYLRVEADAKQVPGSREILNARPAIGSGVMDTFVAGAKFTPWLFGAFFVLASIAAWASMEGFRGWIGLLALLLLVWIVARAIYEHRLYADTQPCEVAKFRNAVRIRTAGGETININAPGKLSVNALRVRKGQVWQLSHSDRAILGEVEIDYDARDSRKPESR